MSVFSYPKYRHTRKLSPPDYRRYQSFKRVLQHEFLRVCVYCRQPDSAAPNIIFSVDHYRPKSIEKFYDLICDYENLYYCCWSCNSRKNDYWPSDESSGRHVVNPCDYDMASHLRFDSSSGRVSARSEHGELTEELLQLNADELVSYRKSVVFLLKSMEAELDRALKEAADLLVAMQVGTISNEDYSAAISEINLEIDSARDVIARNNGSLVMRPLPRGVSRVV